MTTDIPSLCIGPGSSIRQSIADIDRNGKGIVLVVDGERRLLGTVTDGDIRRGLLSGIDLNLPVRALLEQRAPSSHPSPLTAPAGTPDAELLRLMNEYALRHIPLVDGQGRVVDIARLNDLTKEYELPLRAVIMAGGYGMRLRPLTEDLPKPMLPVGDRPLMEIIIRQLKEVGIRKVNVTTHHKPEKIIDHFGNGEAFGVEINYVEESQPLGTAGALGLMKAGDETMLVINGDILTQVDFRAMLSFHREQNADLTVAVRQYGLTVPYGVIECEGASVRRVTEKPLFSFFVNAGIYLLEPVVRQYIPNGRQLDMTDLIQQLLDESRSVASFPIHEYWLDIGQQETYKQAQEKAKKLDTASMALNHGTKS